MAVLLQERDKKANDDRNSITEEDIPTDTAQGPKDEDIVEKKGKRNLVV